MRRLPRRGLRWGYANKLPPPPAFLFAIKRGWADAQKRCRLGDIAAAKPHSFFNRFTFRVSQGADALGGFNSTRFHW